MKRLLKSTQQVLLVLDPVVLQGIVIIWIEENKDQDLEVKKKRGKQRKLSQLMRDKRVEIMLNAKIKHNKEENIDKYIYV